MIGRMQFPSARVAFTSLGLLVCWPASVHARGALAVGVHEVSGAVYERDTGRRLADVRVEALVDGTRVVNHVRTDEQGRFEFQLEQGLYDLRALAPEQRLVTETLANLDVGQGSRKDIQFELQPLDGALAERGFDARDFRDEDGDFVPDALERWYRLDPELADSDEDGVADGIAAWLNTPSRAGGELDVHLHSPLGTLAIAAPASSGCVPLPIVAPLIPGAVRYVLEVTPPGEDEPLDRQEFDFERGEFLAGEGLALRWTPAAGMTEGRYDLHITGYAHAQAEPLSPSYRYEFRTETVEPEALEFEQDGELSGLVHARSIHLHEGVTLRVPARSALFLSALDSILIEAEARIVAAEGSSLWLSAGNWITLHGSLLAGDGQAGQSVRGDSLEDWRAAVGAQGGDLMLVAGGEIQISRSGFVRSGEGGAGLEAQAEVGLGGDGGAGGRLVLLAPTLSVAARPARIVVGGGGPGGAGVAPGVGGASGNVWLSNWDLFGDRYVSLGTSDCPIVGGLAGTAGEPRAGNSVAAQAVHSRFGFDNEKAVGRKGRPGWLVAGDGQSIIAVGGEGAGRGRGGHAGATGGDGGDVARIGMGRNGFDLTFGFVARGGRGGSATAQSGAGGGGDTQGFVGWAGNADAVGGRGGRGHAIPVAMPSQGGSGGSATSAGARGNPGKDHCGDPPRPGGNGSAGGPASAAGGAGGAASWFGGLGGAASATGGRGGDGGSGSSGGSGGRGGSASTRPGAGGEGALRSGERGAANEQNGEHGERGGNC